jgi:hypothetical protein
VKVRVRRLVRTRDGSSSRSDSPRAVIHQRVQELLGRTAERMGAAQLTEIEDLAHLQQLLEIAKHTEPAGPRRATRYVMLFGGILLAIAVLRTCRVSPIEIDLDIITTDVSFVVASSRSITVPLRAKSLTIQGVDHAECPTLPELGAKVATNGVIAAVAPGLASQLDLQSISPSTGDTTFTMATTDVPHQLMLKLGGPREVVDQIEVTAIGPIRLSGSTEPVNFTGQTLRVFGSSARDLVVEVTSPEAHRGSLVSPILAVRQLAFARKEDESTTGQRLLVPRPGIVEGTLDLSATDRTLKLSEGEILEIGCAVGELRRITSTPDGLRVRFHGSACALRAGHDTYRRNLMPTWFDWLRVREVYALWLGVLSVFGIGASLLHWWQKPS